MAELVPDEIGAPAPKRTGLAGLLDTVITWWAMAGGLVFVAIVIMSIISIVGRKLFSHPIEGDMELLMMGAAIGSAAFLPTATYTVLGTDGLAAAAPAPRPRRARP